MKHEPPDDALEAELHSLRPRELPERVVRRVEASLAGEGDGTPTRHPSRWLRRAAAAVGLAACVALAALFWRGRSEPLDTPVVRTPDPAASRPGGGGVHTGRGEGVTVAEYHAAFARSPEAMDALLRQDAQRPARPARRAAAYRAFHGSALDLLDPAGP
jgi:hypothetical protein